MPEASVVIVANNLMSGDYQAWHLNKLSHNSSCGTEGHDSQNLAAEIRD